MNHAGRPDAEEPTTLSAVTAYLDRFIQAWEQEPGPALPAFVPEAPRLRELVLIELIKLDLEYRWLGGEEPLYVEDYLREFPELVQPTAPLAIVYEEYHLRSQAGLRIDREEYFQRFPELREPLGRLIDPAEATSSSAMIDRRCQALLADLEPGQTFDDFDLIVELGRGAFATVFLARQRSMQRLVALKISADRGEEAQTLAQFDHDYIVRVYDQRSLPEEHIRLLYMQYLAGGTLHDVVARRKTAQSVELNGELLFQTVDAQLELRGESRSGRSPWRQELESGAWVNTVCWIGACLAEGLGHSHQQGVLHRDIKPANVLLTAEGIPKLADFNISYCSKLDGATPAAFFGGSLAYMSPEQLEACNPDHYRTADSIDARDDLYSLGVVLYEMMVGRRPFVDPEPNTDWSSVFDELARQRRTVNVEFPSELKIPEVVQSTLSRCWNPDPDERWQSASELQRRLELCVTPSIRRFLFPPQNNLRSRWLPWIHWIMLAGILLPSVLAAVFNYCYNEQKIIGPLSDSVKDHFMVVQLVINLIAFPLGLFISHLVIRASLRGLKSTTRARGKAADWRSILAVGFRGGMVTLAMWSVAGFAYPLSMSMQSIESPQGVYAHFFFSLLLSGVFAVALTYFIFSSIAMTILIPAHIRRGYTEQGLGQEVERLQIQNWYFLLASAAVPMLATVALALIQNQTPWVLGVISFGGMLAFGWNLWLMSRIQNAARRLEAAFGNSPEGGFSRSR